MKQEPQKDWETRDNIVNRMFVNFHRGKDSEDIDWNEDIAPYLRELYTKTRKEAIEACVGVLDDTKELVASEKSEPECWTRDYNLSIITAIRGLKKKIEV